MGRASNRYSTRHIACHVTSSNKWGQVILRHTERTAYRCFLPDLAGFTGFYCTGPGPDCMSGFSPLAKKHRTARGRANSVWRRGWDSNPRSRCRDACFPSMSIRPLSHLSDRTTLKGRILACRSVSGKKAEACEPVHHGRSSWSSPGVLFYDIARFARH
jgi:hypothetical protein